MSDPNTDVIFIEDETLREGFTQIPNALLGRRDLSSGAKLTYVGLLSFAWQKGSCFPGQEKLAEHLGLGKRSVIRHLQELQNANILRVQRRGQGKTNVYSLAKVKVANESAELRQKCQNGTSENAKSALQKMPNRHTEEYTEKEDKNNSNSNWSNQVKTSHTVSYHLWKADKPKGEERSSSPQTGLASIKELLQAKRPAIQKAGGFVKPQQQEKAIIEEYLDVLGGYIKPISQELGDEAPLASSTTWAVNIYQRAGLDFSTFLHLLDEAKKRTQQHTASIHKTRAGEEGKWPRKNKFPYFMSVVEDLCGLKKETGASVATGTE